MDGDGGMGQEEETMNRPMPTLSWLELAVVVVLTIAWMLWRPRPPWQR